MKKVEMLKEVFSVFEKFYIEGRLIEDFAVFQVLVFDVNDSAFFYPLQQS